jgi:glycosidase
MTVGALVCAFAVACGNSNGALGTPAPGPAAEGGADAAIDGGSAPKEGGTAGDAGSTPTDASDAGEPGDAGGTISPIDLASATIYSVYAPIFSAAGNLNGVTADLPRIHALGFDVLYLLPVTSIGKAVNGHPSYGSPYCVHDYYSIDPALGAASDLVTLVRTAHGLGIHVLLDEVLNHTAWDSALITEHPEFYVHSDGNPTNVSSIVQAFTYADVAQLDYKSNNGLAAYMTKMLTDLIAAYDVDGFRFDTADNPYGDGRMIPSSFWVPLRAALEAAKPGFVMLGEEEDPALAGSAFDLDYNWHLQGLYGAGGLEQVATGGSATLLEPAWQFDRTGAPAGMKHMTLLQDWDLGEDIQIYGGTANTMAAATFDFLIDGVPLLFNGEEVGNDKSGLNTRTAIDWNGPNAATFTPFYQSLLALRKQNTALQQGAVTWVTSTAPAQLASFARSDASGAFLVLVNFSNGSVTGTVTLPAAIGASGWVDVSPVGAPGGTAHPAPPNVSLGAYDFAVFRAK